MRGPNLKKGEQEEWVVEVIRRLPQLLAFIPAMEAQSLGSQWMDTEEAHKKSSNRRGEPEEEEGVHHDPDELEESLGVYSSTDDPLEERRKWDTY
ncbi:hypothetical protein NDU88_006967 [Pleurodeles waltl]|uniref:Uncharacterized protein n=1 Tax=Pleurodeles waltl TaxID=8319 RepID=A0AAV7N528_PLEWA|nr:hypothetical protein NDU88_006967 [Pleurodeles waltl]